MKNVKDIRQHLVSLKCFLAFFLTLIILLTQTACQSIIYGTPNDDNQNTGFASDAKSISEPVQLQSYPTAQIAFRSVLLENGAVFFMETGLVGTIEGYMREWEELSGAGFVTEVTAITAVDMDGDGVPEIIIGVQAAEHTTVTYYIILHYNSRDGLVSALPLPFVTFRELKENGMFSTRSGRNYYWNRMRFPETSDTRVDAPLDFVFLRLAEERFVGFEVDKETVAPLYTEYYVNGERATPYEYSTVLAEFMQSPYVAWHTFSASSVEYLWTLF